MYEDFGAVVQEPNVTFRVFLPDNTRDPKFISGKRLDILPVVVRRKIARA